MSNKLLLPVEGAAGKVAVDPSVLFGLIEENALTAFVALPVVLVYPPPELRSLEEPLSLHRTSGVFALHPTEAAAIAAGYHTEVKVLFDYGDYLPERQYRFRKCLVLVDPIFPDSTKLRVNLAEVQHILSVKSVAGGSTSNAPKPVHGNTVHNSQKREQILRAAVAVLAAYPGQCRNEKGAVEATKVRTMIEEKALLFWPAEGEPPLKTEPIEKLIRDCLKSIKPGQ